MGVRRKFWGCTGYIRSRLDPFEVFALPFRRLFPSISGVLFPFVRFYGVFVKVTDRQVRAGMRGNHPCQAWPWSAASGVSGQTGQAILQPISRR